MEPITGDPVASRAQIARLRPLLTAAPDARHTSTTEVHVKMPFIVHGSRRVGRIATALAGLAALAAAPAAQAAPSAANPQGCVPQPVLRQPFAQWGDAGFYTLSPGADFESALTGWELAGGARVTTGTAPFNVGPATDGQSLALPAGSSAVSSRVCIDDTYPWLRLFARDTGARTSSLKLEVLYLHSSGKLKTRASGSYTAAPSAWAPTGTMKIDLRFDTSSAGGAAPVAFRFTPQGGGSSWQIDDVYVDPMARR